ncbi:flagellar basal body P-ring formation chaperone FlgA [Methylobacterium sp. 092160098-2]|uniref:Flagella basal body P-ring formation protein FlgA n=2 Tax=Methylobacterium TaxID=407 RepID=A0A089NLL6_9HYPH|nr:MULTISPECIES: flagellar basal body P-ring formation chaperone FlgA [Methylobacterium]AIQ88791.1 Flagella basal body P-ring formation protein FlgA [Methylobacterium oryzae CBMB20]MBA9062672.1 flagella basal body P-ring formation protein FlgA [Methylobacterium fujisawaense]MDE4915690.1 flagellar basal body P-ring formation chaperone FlgA [Methylobacterium sp. 092160098-2]MDH3029507.1 flagellar basal body P-ring formation chaperone FlgA [Methylobacterium fujisawaense]
MYAGMHPAHPAHPDPDFETLDLPRIGMADGSDISPIIRRPRPRVSPLGSAVILRAVLAFLTFAVLGALAIPAMAQAEGLRLRGDVTARGDILTLADLVEGVPERLAARPLFRAPTLGATGTIQTRRILDAAAALGLANLETGGRLQIAVQRAARRLGPPEIEAALKRGLETSYGLDPRSVTIRFDGDGPTLLAPVDLEGQAAALDVTYDLRSRRVAGLVSLGERQASLRVSGVVVELREVAVLTRTLNRGEPVKEGDVVAERRPRETVASDAQGSATAVIGEVAQNTLTAGTVLRMTDTAPPELVARGENVTIVYETPNVSLSMRGLSNDSGRMGAVVNVVNVASKKILQATVIGPGRVSVSPSPAAQQAAGAAPVQATASLR